MEYLADVTEDFDFNFMSESDEMSQYFNDRYLTVHQQDLLSLEKEFPEAYAEFERGNFSVQVSNTNPFGRTEADKTTINRDTKTPGGTTGNLII